MTDINIFEKASKSNLRFLTAKGQIMSEDLWSLPLTSTTGKINLDDIARSISAKIKESEVESFVHKSTAANTLEKLRLDIVKRVIEVKIAERDAVKKEREIAARKQALLEALSSKKADSLTKMSEEELEAELKNLG